MEIGVYCPSMHHRIGLDAFLGRPFPPGPTTEAILEQMHRFVQDVRPQLPAGGLNKVEAQ